MTKDEAINKVLAVIKNRMAMASKPKAQTKVAYAFSS
jgi:hypothetical protein